MQLEYNSNSINGLLFDSKQLQYSMCSGEKETLQGANLGFTLKPLEEISRSALRNKLFPGQFPKEESKIITIHPCSPTEKDKDIGRYNPRFQIEKRIDVKEIIYKGERSFATNAQTTGWIHLKKLSTYKFSDEDIEIASKSLVCKDKPRCEHFISNIEYRISYDSIIVLTLHSSEFYD
jgi:hypothetical protein